MNEQGYSRNFSLELCANLNRKLFAERRTWADVIHPLCERSEQVDSDKRQKQLQAGAYLSQVAACFSGGATEDNSIAGSNNGSRVWVSDCDRNR